MSRTTRTGRPASRAAPVALLLGLTLVLTTVLAYQALDAARSHRAVAEKTLSELASVGAWGFTTAARRALENELGYGLDILASFNAKDPDLAFVPGGLLPPGSQTGIQWSGGAGSHRRPRLVPRLAGGLPSAADSGGRRGRSLRLGGSGVTLQVSGSRNPGDSSSISDRGVARLFFERRGSQGFGGFLELFASGVDFRPALGFEARDSFASAVSDLTYTWFPGESSRFTRLRAFLTTRAYVRTTDGELDSGLVRFRLQATTRRGHFYNVAWNIFIEDLAQPLSLPGAVVPAGRYPGVDLFQFFELNRALPVGFSTRVYFGSLMDGHQVDLELSPRLNLSRHLSAEATFQHQRFYFKQRGERVNADRIRLSLLGALNPRLSLQGLVQYSAAADVYAANLRLRYRFAEGRDLYVVFDQATELFDRDARFDVLGPSDHRLLFKYSHTFAR